MFSLILSIFFFALAATCASLKIPEATIAASSFSMFALIRSATISVPTGYVKVGTLFGKVNKLTYREGIHLVNPLLKFHGFDLRQKTLKETVGISAEDKLLTTMNIPVQYRVIESAVPEIFKNTGLAPTLLRVHLIPKLRSVLREMGKSVAVSQDFFKESVQQQLQRVLHDNLSAFLVPKGLEIQAVLIRGISLPGSIQKSISEFEAAKLEAQKIKELADAEAYKIEAINKTLAKSPNYIALKKVEQWNGVLPVYAGGDNVPMVDLRN